MDDRHKTPVAAKLLGVPYYVLIDLLRFERIEPPAKDSSGHYVWSNSDLERARQALLKSRRSKRQEAVA